MSVIQTIQHFTSLLTSAVICKLIKLASALLQDSNKSFHESGQFRHCLKIKWITRI